MTEVTISTHHISTSINRFFRSPIRHDDQVVVRFPCTKTFWPHTDRISAQSELSRLFLEELPETTADDTPHACIQVLKLLLLFADYRCFFFHQFMLPKVEPKARDVDIQDELSITQQLITSRWPSGKSYYGRIEDDQVTDGPPYTLSGDGPPYTLSGRRRATIYPIRSLTSRDASLMLVSSGRGMSHHSLEWAATATMAVERFKKKIKNHEEPLCDQLL